MIFDTVKTEYEADLQKQLEDAKAKCEAGK
jgi:hypothetical protein